MKSIISMCLFCISTAFAGDGGPASMDESPLSGGQRASLPQAQEIEQKADHQRPSIEQVDALLHHLKDNLFTFIPMDGHSFQDHYNLLDRFILGVKIIDKRQDAACIIKTFLVVMRLASDSQLFRPDLQRNFSTGAIARAPFMSEAHDFLKAYYADDQLPQMVNLFNVSHTTTAMRRFLAFHICESVLATKDAHIISSEAITEIVRHAFDLIDIETTPILLGVDLLKTLKALSQNPKRYFGPTANSFLRVYEQHQPQEESFSFFNPLKSPLGFKTVPQRKSAKEAEEKIVKSGTKRKGEENDPKAPPAKRAKAEKEPKEKRKSSPKKKPKKSAVLEADSETERKVEAVSQQATPQKSTPRKRLEKLLNAKPKTSPASLSGSLSLFGDQPAPENVRRGMGETPAQNSFDPYSPHRASVSNNHELTNSDALAALRSLGLGDSRGARKALNFASLPVALPSIGASSHSAAALPSATPLAVQTFEQQVHRLEEFLKASEVDVKALKESIISARAAYKALTQEQRTFDRRLSFGNVLRTIATNEPLCTSLIKIKGGKNALLYAIEFVLTPKNGIVPSFGENEKLKEIKKRLQGKS